MFRTEADLSRAIRKLLRGMEVRTAYRRIEDASGNLGTHDSFIAVDGRAIWCELKVAGPNAKPDIRPGQSAFGVMMMRAGISSCFMVGHPDGSLRLISVFCEGDDWRDHLICRFDALTEEVIWRMLEL